MTEIQHIAGDLIHAEGNDRKEFDPAGLQELAKSIATNGLAQPPTVRPLKDGTYGIVAGERRTRAMLLLGWAEMPVIVRDLTDEEASAIMLAENTSRADLLPIEEAAAYQRRIDEFKWSFATIAEKAGVSVAVVKSRIALLKLAPALHTLVNQGVLPLSHAELLVDLSHERQLDLARLYGNKPVDQRTLQMIINQMIEADMQMGLFSLEDVYVAQVEADKITNGMSFPIADLPVPFVKGMNSCEVMMAYIRQLADDGHNVEAAVVGSVLAVLLDNRLVKPPRHARK
ncbi:MAG: ParB/RepB/Spo0J family partition protein [Anderseniella sp.]